MWIMMNGTRFWSGNRWVNEYPDAALYDVTNGNQLMASARKIGATSIVRDYGTNVEKCIHVPWTAVTLDDNKSKCRACGKTLAQCNEQPDCLETNNYEHDIPGYKMHTTLTLVTKA